MKILDQETQPNSAAGQQEMLKYQGAVYMAQSIIGKENLLADEGQNIREEVRDSDDINDRKSSNPEDVIGPYWPTVNGVHQEQDAEIDRNIDRNALLGFTASV